MVRIDIPIPAMMPPRNATRRAKFASVISETLPRILYFIPVAFFVFGDCLEISWGTLPGDFQARTADPWESMPGAGREVISYAHSARRKNVFTRASSWLTSSSITNPS